MVTRGEACGEEMVREFGTDMYTLSYLKWTNKDPLWSTGNSAQCCVAAWMGGESGGERIHIYARLSHFAVHLKLPNIVNRLYSDIKESLPKIRSR